MNRQTAATMLAAALPALLCVAILASRVASAPVSAAPPVPRLLVVGDSLVTQAADSLRARGATVLAYPGTAPCDWLTRLPQAFTRTHPTVVVAAFVGNHGTPCMAGVRSAGDLAARYQVAYTSMAVMARAVGARLVLSVPPLMRPNRAALYVWHGDPALELADCALAMTNTDVSCDYSARRLLSEAGWSVRAADGVHLAGVGPALYAQGLLAAATAR